MILLVFHVCIMKPHNLRLFTHGENRIWLLTFGIHNKQALGSSSQTCVNGCCCFIHQNGFTLPTQCAFFQDFVSSFNSWKVVLWVDTSSENGIFKWFLVIFSGILNFLLVWACSWVILFRFFRVFFYFFNCSNIHRPVRTCRR